MKKWKERRLPLLLMCFLLIWSFVGIGTVTVRAQETVTGYVNDWADILSDVEVEDLEERAERISETYQCGMYLFTVDDYRDYLTSGRKGVENAVKDLADNNSLGLGSDRSCMILLLSMDDRDFATVAHGYGNTAFTDYGKVKLDEVFLDDFRENDWYEGFYDYLERCEEYLEMAKEGRPFDVDTDDSDAAVAFVFGYGLSAVFGIILAAILCHGWKAQMKTAREKTSAGNYAVLPGIQYRSREDRFNRRSRTMRKIEEESHGSGGGGTTVDSGGYSSHSGKF